MSYRHILNSYQNPGAFLAQFAEGETRDEFVYATEKVHGTSSHLSFRDGTLHFSPGGEKLPNFQALFDIPALTARFERLSAEVGGAPIVVFGETYGGKQQGQSARYGKALSFIVFEVKVGDEWFDVPTAAVAAWALGLEFVPWEKIPATIEAMDAERDAPSEVARRRGVVEPQVREGVVIRPLDESRRDEDGRPVRSKHKSRAFSETATTREVIDPSRQRVLTEANAVAIEWVTEERLRHVLDKLSPPATVLSDIPRVIGAMSEDVEREARTVAGSEIEWSDAVRSAISKRTAKMFRERVTVLPRA